MQRSKTRFLTTHTGSLPRPDDLIRMMYAKEEGVPVDTVALAERGREGGGARGDRSVLPQRAFPEPGGLSGGHRRGHAARIRDDRSGWVRSADRLSRPRHGPP